MPGLKVDTYQYLPGMQQLLESLNSSGYELHAMSNYPMWYRCGPTPRSPAPSASTPSVRSSAAVLRTRQTDIHAWRARAVALTPASLLHAAVRRHRHCTGTGCTPMPGCTSTASAPALAPAAPAPAVPRAPFRNCRVVLHYGVFIPQFALCSWWPSPCRLLCTPVAVLVARTLPCYECLSCQWRHAL